LAFAVAFLLAAPQPTSEVPALDVDPLDAAAIPPAVPAVSVDVGPVDVVTFPPPPT